MTVNLFWETSRLSDTHTVLQSNETCDIQSSPCIGCIMEGLFVSTSKAVHV